MPADITRAYEGLFLFGTASSVATDDALKLVQALIEKHGGIPHVLRKWDDRKLAYEVKKQTRGVYLLTYFTAPPAAVDAINREVNITDEMLRCLITDASHLSPEEVEAMQPQKPAPRKVREDDAPVRRDDYGDEADVDPSASDALDDDQVSDETEREAAPARGRR